MKTKQYHALRNSTIKPSSEFYVTIEDKTISCSSNCATILQSFMYYHYVYVWSAVIVEYPDKLYHLSLQLQHVFQMTANCARFVIFMPLFIKTFAKEYFHYFCVINLDTVKTSADRIKIHWCILEISGYSRLLYSPFQ